MNAPLHRLYVLDGHTPIRCEDATRWIEFMGAHDTHVACDTVGMYKVCTIFLGVDRRHVGFGAPLLFETAVYQPDQRTCDLYPTTSWDEAMARHRQEVQFRRMCESLDLS